MGPSAYWYLTRGTGAVSLVLLTASVVLGVLVVNRVHSREWPRFALDAIHRNISLLAMAILAVHIVTSILDGFASIRLVDAVIPFGGAYRPFWLGLGALSFDLLIAVVLTSLLRRRLGYRAWRLTHWLAYASWPVAVVHGLGTGSDTKAGWMLALTVACVLAVVVSVWARAAHGWPANLGSRVSAAAAATILPLGLIVWLPGGPLGAGWAGRAGTPASLLARSSTQSSDPATSTGVAGPFSAPVSGSLSQGQVAGGLVRIDLALSVSGQNLGSLRIALEGVPVSGGGVNMSASDVRLGTGANPSLYRGAVTALSGSSISATLSGPSGRRLSLVANLEINSATGAVSGQVNVAPAGA